MLVLIGAAIEHGVDGEIESGGALGAAAASVQKQRGNRGKALHSRASADHIRWQRSPEIGD
jgi:hypothetical protein